MTTMRDINAACRVLGIKPWMSVYKPTVARAKRLAAKKAGRKVKRAAPIKRDLGNNPETFSVQGPAWGGMSYKDATIQLVSNGVPAERFAKGYSPYVGNFAIVVHKRWANRAARILLGR